MDLISKYEEKLIKRIGQKKLVHSIGVMQTAKRLSQIYGEDINKAALAGILHDCGKIKNKRHLLKKINYFGIILDGIMQKDISLAHGLLGSVIANEEFGIKDEDVLNAIKFHTTGRKDMSLLEKIIYISDYIEPNRDFPGVEEIRKLAFKDLDKSILISMNNTINHIIKKDKFIHIDTIEARNSILSHINGQNKVSGGNFH